MESRTRGKFNAQIYEEACDWFGECRSGERIDSALGTRSIRRYTSWMKSGTSATFRTRASKKRRSCSP